MLSFLCCLTKAIPSKYPLRNLQHLVAIIFDVLARRRDHRVQIINVGIRHIEQDTIATVLGDEHRRNRQHGALDAAFVEAREHIRRRAELHDLNVAHGHLPPLQHHQQNGMRNRADTGDTDSFPFEIRRRLDVRFADESLQPFVDDARDHHCIAAAQRRGNQHVACRVHHLDVIGKQRADARGATLTGNDDLGVNPIFTK